MNFEERAVAFIDILGFKSLVNKAANDSASLQQLSNLVELLESAIPRLDREVDSSVPSHLIPKYFYISDCIILSAPLFDDKRHDYKGLEIVIMRAIQLTHFFLNAGYLIRGGIAVGKVWHSNTNIVGPAYQEAYLLEDNGDEPIVVLSAASAAFIQHKGSRMCLEQDGKVFVNGLHDFYIPGNTAHGVIEETYKKYEVLVEEALKSNLPSSAINKWAWFKTFLESESKEGLQWAGG